MKKRIVCVLMAAVMVFALCACNGQGSAPSPSPSKSPAAKASPSPKASPAPAATLDPALTQNKVNIKIEMENGGIIKAELYPDIAPITVANFKKLAGEKFYNGLTFHRIIKGFMIQGGDPEGTGAGGAAEQIKGEFRANGVENNLSHTRGVLSMARNSISMDSASSQFFIVHQDSNFLDGEYAAFGKVTEGMDVVDALAENTPVEDTNGTVAAANQPKIKSITVD